MKQRLEAALRSDLALLSGRRPARLIGRALELYRLGFKHLSASQMAAVGELIRRAGSFDEAVADVEGWLSNALRKLEARRDRTDRVESWLLPPADGPGESLGAVLIEWISGQSYLEPPPPPELDRLAALRRFWERFHGLYRYRVETGREMPLDGPHTEEEK